MHASKGNFYFIQKKLSSTASLITIFFYILTLLSFLQFFYSKKNNFFRDNFSKSIVQKNNILTHYKFISYCYGKDRIALINSNQNLKNNFKIYLLSANKSTIALGKNKYLYTPYGQVITKETSKFINPFLYNGERYDLHTNLQYLKTRFYKPQIQKFISKDNFKLSNRFNFADLNPIMKNDPTGHFSCFNFFSGLVGLIFAFGISEFEFSACSLVLTSEIKKTIYVETTPFFANILQIISGIFDTSTFRKISWVNADLAMPIYSISTITAGFIKSGEELLKIFTNKIIRRAFFMSMASISLNTIAFKMNFRILQELNFNIPDINPDDSYKTAYPCAMNLLASFLAAGSFLMLPDINRLEYRILNENISREASVHSAEELVPLIREW